MVYDELSGNVWVVLVVGRGSSEKVKEVSMLELIYNVRLEVIRELCFVEEFRKYNIY